MVSCNVAGLPVEDKLKLRKIHILNKDIIQTCDFNQVHRSYLVSDIAAVLFVGLTEVGVGVVLFFDVIVEAVVDVDVGTVEVDDVVDKVLMLVDTVVVDEVVDEAVVLVDTVVVAAIVDVVVVVEAVVDLDVGSVLVDEVVEAVVDTDVGTLLVLKKVNNISLEKVTLVQKMIFSRVYCLVCQITQFRNFLQT